MTFFLFLISVFHNLWSFIPEDSFTENAVGKTVFNYLKNPVSPRFYALGENGITEYGIDSVFYNPAGTVVNNRNSFYVDFQKGISEIYRNDFAYLRRIDKKSSGFFLSYLNYGDFIKTDKYGNLTGYFSPSDFLAGFSYSYGKHDRIGFNIKYLYSDMVYYKASSIAFDIGVILKSTKTRYAFLIRNIGFESKIQGKSYPLPSEFIIGARYIYSNSISSIFEYKIPSYSSSYASGGFEYFKDFDDIRLYLRV